MVKSIGERIKQIRQERKLSQVQFAQTLSVSQTVVTDWERDLRTPQAEMIVKISDLFSVSCDWILTGNKAENLNTVKELGLSNDVIDRLRDYKKNTILNLPKVLNQLCKYEFLLSDLNMFLKTDFRKPYTIQKDGLTEGFPTVLFSDINGNGIVNGFCIPEMIELTDFTLYENAALIGLIESIKKAKSGGDQK